MCVDFAYALKLLPWDSKYRFEGEALGYAYFDINKKLYFEFLKECQTQPQDVSNKRYSHGQMNIDK